MVVSNRSQDLGFWPVYLHSELLRRATQMIAAWFCVQKLLELLMDPWKPHLIRHTLTKHLVPCTWSTNL